MRQGFLGGGLALGAAILALLAAAASAAGPIVITWPNPGGVPTLTVTQTGPGQVTATWTTPRPTDGSINLHWDTSSATTPLPASYAADEGTPLSCWMTGPSDGVHGCKGGADQGDPSRRAVVSGLATGVTYWFQIEVEGVKDEYINGSPAGKSSYEGFSAPVSVTVTAKGGGGTSGGSTASGVRAAVSVGVTITRADGRTLRVSGRTAVGPGDTVATGAKPGGVDFGDLSKLVLDRNSRATLASIGDLESSHHRPDYVKHWQLARGSLWYSIANGEVIIETPTATIDCWVTGPDSGSFTVETTASSTRVRDYSDACIDGLAVYPKGGTEPSEGNVTTGQQVTVPAGGSPSPAATFRPTAHRFWR